MNIGPHAKVDINEVPFACKSGNYQITRDLPDVTSTEDAPGGTVCEASTLRTCQLTLTCGHDPDVAYNGAPLDLQNPAGIWVRVWLNGRGDPDNVLDIPVFKVAQQTGDFNVQGSAEQTLQIQGRSSGDFFAPGEV